MKLDRKQRSRIFHCSRLPAPVLGNAPFGDSQREFHHCSEDANFLSALRNLQKGETLLPVDLAQTAIGPGDGCLTAAMPRCPRN